MRRKKKIFVRFMAVLLLVGSAGAFYLFHIPDWGDREQTQPFEEKQRNHFKIAILIDDIGYDFSLLLELINIDAPLSFAVLPYYPHSVDAARALHAKGKEVILHLPMEPHTYPDEKPGAGALLLKMSEEEIIKQVEEDIAAVPFVSGVNNHMGSKFMEDEAKLSVVFNQLKKRNLFFVDSRTTPSSKAEKVAKISGIPFISRRIFIDTEHHYRATLQNLMKLSKEAQRRNSEPILVIGHPYPDTIRALRKAIPALEAEGAVFVSVSDLVK